MGTSIYFKQFKPKLIQHDIKRVLLKIQSVNNLVNYNVLKSLICVD